ncbi:MAG: CCA tRNA nucleotidyltransferase [Candidatus Micrarchaeota archaeon]
MYVMEHTMDMLLGRTIRKIKPTESEKRDEEQLSEEVMRKLRRVVPPYIEVSLAGSLAKDTNLKDDNDLDIFLLFPLSHSVKDLEIMGLEWAKKALAPHKWTVGYAEHPYLQAVFKGSKLDIVPSFKISHIDEKASSVDRSPLHTQYVNSKLSADRKDQVRLLKKFLKNFNLYGAELKTEGFSGYLCELLITYFGSFKHLLKSAEQWKGQVVIDVERHYGEHELAGKFLSPFVVIDAVDRNRNVAAVVSKSALYRFVYASREFLKNPDESFFFSEEKQPSLSTARKLIHERGTEFIAILFPAPDVVPDILWPQLKRTERNLAKHMELGEFSIFGKSHWTDEAKRCVLLFEFTVFQLPLLEKVSGPPVFQAVDCDNFVAKHRSRAKGMWVEEDRIVALEKRRHTSAISLLREMLKAPREYGVPENIAKHMGKARILTGEAIVTKKTLGALSNHIRKRLP